MPFLDDFSKQSQKYKNPKDRILALDETLRPSFSKKDPTSFGFKFKINLYAVALSIDKNLKIKKSLSPYRTYMPSKPCHYGEKFFTTAEKQTVCITL